MDVFEVVLLVATLLCSLVAGFLLAFATVVMPGIGKLDDGGFIRGFQMIDGIIQRNQPLFMLVWVGSVLMVVATAVLGVWALNGADRVLAIVAALLYLLCVQFPTMRINIPLNNALQKLTVDALSPAAQKRARDDFEARWNRWNSFRTACATLTSFLLMVLLVRT